MVFQTAPPHPASKARWTWAPELLGGADASQYGLGERMPANSMLRSATTRHPLSGAVPAHVPVDSLSGKFSVLRGHNRRRRAPRANAVAAGVHTGQVRLVLFVHLN